MKPSAHALALLTLFGVAHAQSLEESVQAAAQSNPSLESARLSLRAAEQDRAQARAAYMPSVSINGSYGVSTIENLRERRPTTRTYLQPSIYSLDVSQSLYTGGRRGARIDIARAGADGAREALRAVEQETVLGAIAAHLDVMRDETIVRFRREDVLQLERQTQAVGRRLEAGLVTRTDLSQAHARLAVAQAGISIAEAQLEGSRAAYREIVGREPAALLAATEIGDGPQSLREAVDRAMRENPDVLRALASVRAARARIEVERAAMRPQVSVAGRLGSDDETQTPELEQREATAVLRVATPLYEGGFYRARLRQSRLEAERSEVDVEIVRRQVTTEVIAAWAQWTAAQRVLESARLQVDANRSALTGVEREQALGLRTVIETLNASREVLDAQIAQAQAERDVHFAHYRVLAAIGALSAAQFQDAAAHN